MATDEDKAKQLREFLEAWREADGATERAKSALASARRAAAAALEAADAIAATACEAESALRAAERSRDVSARAAREAAEAAGNSATEVELGEATLGQASAAGELARNLYHDSEEAVRRRNERRETK
jgi:hypothetical protein